MSSRAKKDLHKCSGPETKAEECMHALIHTVKIMKRFGESKLAQRPEFKKLSGPRIGLIFMIEKVGAIRMGDLASKLMIAPRTVTDFVDGLERDGFVRRVADPSDRRAMLIELTPETKAQFPDISNMRKRFAEDLFSTLSSKEQDDLIRILDKLRKGPLSELVQTEEISD
jgi:DNA-binding MarR family transcriptional regulator